MTSAAAQPAHPDLPSHAPLVRAARAVRGIYRRRSSRIIVTRHVDLRPRGSALGLRIVLASDIHARDEWFPRECVADTVDAINAVGGVDLVTLTGDFVSDDAASIDWSAEEYARIAAPTAAVLGNHDHWTDADRVEQALLANGVCTLVNRSIPLEELVPGRAGAAGAGAALWLAGLDSCWPGSRRSRRPDPDATFAGVPTGAEVVVLGHEPFLATMHEHVLHLAGHTHCGQVRTPIFGDQSAKLHMPRFSEPYACRLHEVPVQQPAGVGAVPPSHRTTRPTRWIYTTAGVGYSTVSVRLFCPPEIVVIDA